MDTTYETFTPETSRKILDERNNCNRKLRDEVVEGYVRDMVAGRWTQCVDPIVFTNDGFMVSGQHRLWAVVKSGQPQQFLVVRELPREAGLNIDTGLGRSLQDNLHFSGAEAISTSLYGVARAMEYGQFRSLVRRASMTEKIQLVERHREAASWALSKAPRTKGGATGSMLAQAAIGRAYYWETDKAMLAKFGHGLSTGEYSGEREKAVLVMRNYLLANKDFSNARLWRDSFLKIQNAIWYFMRQQSLTVIKSVKDERYPLPDRSTGETTE